MPRLLRKRTIIKDGKKTEVVRTTGFGEDIMSTALRNMGLDPSAKNLKFDPAKLTKEVNAALAAKQRLRK